MNEIVFENIKILWFLAAIPVFFLLFAAIRHKRKKQLQLLGNQEVVKKLMLEVSNFRPWLKFSLLMFVLALLIVALARPQFATETKVNANESSEIIIALDISNSMLAKSPNSSFTRLKLAKNAISNLIENLHNEKVGLVVFAGQAVMQIPLTNDYSAFKLILKSISPSYLTAQGTAIADAIDIACDAFTPEKNNQRSIIIISDGEDHEGDLDKAIQKAKQNGVKIYTVGIGSPRGNSIIINGEPLRDKQGNIVISKLNETVLMQIAKETDGQYINFSTNSRALKEIYDKMNNADAEGKTKVAKYDEKYHYFVFPALVILILEFFILLRTNRWIVRIKIFEK